jgi:dihydroorotate dehydrogenase (fumarate)
LVPSASPLSKRIENLQRMEEAGAGAVVLHSLFEEQIEFESRALDHYLTYGSESFAEALSYFPEPHEYRLTPEQHVDYVRKAKAAISIPIIASLNGASTGGWTRYAGEIEAAGADALELNMYFLPTDLGLRGEIVEDRYADLLSEVRRTVAIPVAVKLSPFFSSLPNMARRLVHAGAQGLVMFNRFYQPDLDIEMLEVVPHLVLSDSDELRLPLRWIAILYGRIQADLALTTGVHTADDVLKGLMAGASVTMLASELLQYGIGRLGVILAELQHWMAEHEYVSVAQLRGCMSQMTVANPAAFERAQYVRLVGTLEPR